MEFNLRGGALLIGSLFWQDHLDLQRGDNIRKKWRKERLCMEEVINVTVPIKYGRFSGTKTAANQAYTMIFDNQLKPGQYGKAKAIPFKLGIVHTFEEIKAEVIAISEAEGAGYDFLKGNPAWCACAIVFKPGIEENIKNYILLKWAAAYEGSVGFAGCGDGFEAYCVRKTGELDIPWPPEAKGFDFLIATATKAKLRRGITELSVEEIVAYLDQRPYFYPNQAHGITTCQDDAIKRIALKLKEASEI